MAKDKNILERHGPTSGSFINQFLKNSFTTKISAPESSHDINVIMKEPREVKNVEIKIIKKLLKNIKKQHKLIKIMTNFIKKKINYYTYMFKFIIIKILS